VRRDASVPCRVDRGGRKPRLPFALALVATLIALLALPASSFAKTITEEFEFEGTNTFEVPAEVTSVQVQAIGADGGCEAGGCAHGGEANAPLGVKPGETLEVVVGGVGGQAISGFPDGGFNGGGAGGEGAYGGGGESDVRTGSCAAGENCSAGSAVVVGAGGGGTASTAGRGAPMASAAPRWSSTKSSRCSRARTCARRCRAPRAPPTDRP
jgi:hypothetical protein